MPGLILACTGEETTLGRHWLTKALPSLPFPYVTCGTCGPSYWNERFLRMCLLLVLLLTTHNIKQITPVPYLFYTSPYGHELCAYALTLPIPYYHPPVCLLGTLTPNSAMSASLRVVRGEWVLVTPGMAGSARSLMVLLRNPVFKRCSFDASSSTICTVFL